MWDNDVVIFQAAAIVDSSELRHRPPVITQKSKGVV